MLGKKFLSCALVLCSFFGLSVHGTLPGPELIRPLSGEQARRFRFNWRVVDGASEYDNPDSAARSGEQELPFFHASFRE